VKTMNKMRKAFLSAGVGMLAVLTAFSVYLLADSFGLASGVAEQDAATLSAQQERKPGLEAGLAPAGMPSNSVEFEEPVEVQTVGGESSGLATGEVAAQALSASDPAAAGLAPR
jgi:hypothetical protein